MSPLLITILTFVAALLVFFGAYSVAVELYLRDRSASSQRLREEERERHHHLIKRSPLHKQKAEGTERLLEVIGEHTLMAGVRRLLEQSGLEITLERQLAITLAFGGIAAVVAYFAGVQWLLALALGLAAASLPWLYVAYRRWQRREAMLRQIPDAYDLIARTIRAGRSVSQAMRAVADDRRPPLSSEFSYCCEQQDLGLAPDVALRDLAVRTGLVEIKIFVVSLLVHKQTGGNLAQILEDLATLVRSRFHLREKIRILTAQGKLEAGVLLSLPPLMFFIMLYLSPAYCMVLFDHPYALAGVLALVLVGVVWIRQIVHFDL